jgi:phosphoenolpyruvate carboxylase
MNIGSRPARRGGGSSVAGLRAIPWQFAWTQTRLMLGAGSGSKRRSTAPSRAGEAPQLAAMYREWPAFQSAVDLIEMVLAKADGGLPPNTIAGWCRPPSSRSATTFARAWPGPSRRRAPSPGHASCSRRRRHPALDRRAEPVCGSVESGPGGTARRMRDAPIRGSTRALMVTVNGIAAGCEIRADRQRL